MPASTLYRQAGVVVMTIAAATLARLSIAHAIWVQSPFALYLAAVMISAWWGGLRAGLAATLLATGLTATLFAGSLEPDRPGDLAGLLRLGLFVLEGGLISALCESLHRARQEAAALLRDREEALVRERTARAELEAAVRAKDAAAAALRFSEYRARALADAMPLIVWTTRPDGGPDHYNQRWFEYTGLSLEDPRGWESAGVLHPDDLADGAARWHRALETGEPFEAQCRLRRADGSWRWQLTRALPVRETGGTIVLWVGTSTDIDDQKRAGERKDEYLAMLAHELRNPLAPILSAARLLGRPEVRQAEAARALERIERQVRHLSRLVDDLLDVSRITRGRIELQRAPLELAPVVQQAIESCGPQLEAREHDLTVELPPSPIFLDADPARVAQIVCNLLDNALKYTPRGGHIWLTVAREEHEGDPRAVIRVRDTGIGIAPDLLPRVFDLFIQGERPLDRQQGGLGIGLTLVRSLVEQHGGVVEVSSEGEGRGAEFRVVLPALREWQGRLTAPLPPRSGRPLAPAPDCVQLPAAPEYPSPLSIPGSDTATPAPLFAGPPLPTDRLRDGRELPTEVRRDPFDEGAPPGPPERTRLLVVDDNVDAAETMVTLLELWGYEVRMAHDGPTALQLARACRPHVLLLDIGLPGMDGYELARRIRAEATGRSAMLIALTGYGQSRDRRRAAEAGFDHFFTKPVDLEMLEQLLKEAQTRRRTIQPPAVPLQLAGPF